MEKYQTCVTPLKTLALRQIGRDIVRHYLNSQAQMDNELPLSYEMCMFHFSSDILHIIKNEFQRIPGHLFRGCPLASHRNFLDFVFNSFATRLPAPAGGYGEQILSTIARNCRGSLYFTTSMTLLDPDIYFPFLRTMTNLRVLALTNCSFLNFEILEVISDSLLQLESLNLDGTNVTDEGLFALCGHKQSRCFLLPSCFYAKKCEAECSLRLSQLFLDGVIVSNMGISCVLTHIQTLQKIAPSISDGYRVSEAIYQIALFRQTHEMPNLSYEITEFRCPNPMDNWETLFNSCPKLRAIVLTVTDDHPDSDQDRDRSLAESDFNHLRQINLMCRSVSRLLTKEFECFWRSKGRQIRCLNIMPLGDEDLVSHNPQDLRAIVNMCPYLQHMSITQLLLSENIGRKIAFEEFPFLGNVRTLTIGMLGVHDLVTAEVFQIVSAAKNVRILNISMPVAEEILFQFVNQQSFPHLRNLYFTNGITHLFYEYLL